MPLQVLDSAPTSPWFPRWIVGAACVVVETDQGTALVDTGVGVHDHVEPQGMVRSSRWTSA